MTADFINIVLTYYVVAMCVLCGFGVGTTVVLAKNKMLTTEQESKLLTWVFAIAVSAAGCFLALVVLAFAHKLGVFN